MKQTNRSKRCVTAFVLGTALGALGAARAPAAELSADRAVSSISRYCTACWRNARLHPDAWDDCTQEVFCRLLERVTPEAWDRILALEGAERRELIRAVDAVKKRTQRGRKLISLADDVADRTQFHRNRLEIDGESFRQAASDLSARQRQIVTLSLDGWTVHDIARELRVPAARISDEKYKAIHKLHDRLAV